MLYDLHVPWSSTSSMDLQRTISFLSELKYSVIALTHHITGAIPSQIINPIPNNLSFKVPANMAILRRCTLTISDPALNYRLPALASAYDLLALRPTNEKAFMAACNTIDNYSIISLDLTIRYLFHFRPKLFMTAIRRGIKFEICYAQAIQGEAENRRNFITNTLAIVRATGGRGLIVSSEARSVLGVRAPADVENLLHVWGVGRERAKEAMTVTPRSVAVNEGIRRRGYRGLVDVLEGDERDVAPAEPDERLTINGGNAALSSKGKRKHGKDGIESGLGTPMTTTPISKRQAKRMRVAARSTPKKGSLSPSARGTPLMPETQGADKPIASSAARAQAKR